MSKTWKRLLSVLLVVSMLVSLTVTGYAAGTTTKSGRELELEELDPSTLNVPVVGQQEEDETAETLPYGFNDIVRVSIFLDAPSTLDKGYSTQNIAQNSSAMAYRQTLRRQQATVTANIEKAIKADLDVVWNLTLAANAISANVRYGDIATIKNVAGVKSVELENRYEATSVADRPNTAITTEEMVGAAQAWADGYYGAGSRVAIIDTGLDTDHQSFNADAFDYAVAEDAEKAGKTVADYNLLTADEISSVASELNGKGVYMTTKIPYAFNYVDKNTTVNHLNDKQGEHGSHVAGIATANRYINNDGKFEDAASTVYAVGVAPDAQVMVMKVFGAAGGAYDSDYMVAIEDAIVLKADSVNLSLGSSVAGFTFSDGYEDIMNSLVENGTVVTISAGNNSSWGGNLLSDVPYLYEQDINFHTGGSPGSFTNSLGIASADNVGVIGTPIIFNGEQKVFYTETSGYGNAPMSSIPGTYDYIYVDGPGVTGDGVDQFAPLAEQVAGKIALCNRGASSFYQKANAAVKAGAVGVVIVNNQAGSINMNLQGYEYTAPAVSITQAEGQAIKAASASETIDGVTVYTGKVEVSGTMDSAVNKDRSEATMSSFSSWGVPGSLIMKPELTTPGGNIYSVNGAHLNETTGVLEAGDNASYEVMSGTSMAAPHAAGMAAVLGQYVRENEMAKWTDGNARHLMNSLLMSTATPMIDPDSESYYPVLQQGAGLADVYAATQAKSFITMNEDATASYADGKVKVELGDQPDRTGVYSYSFNITNMSEETLTYELNTDMFTQDKFAYGDYAYLDTWTTELPAEVTYEWGDFEFEDHDVDMNGITNTADADAILKYLTGEITDEGLDLAAGDMDKDGKPSSYDAHLLLALLEQEIEERGDLAVPAGETVTVTVNIMLTDTATLDEKYATGAYVEGYTYVTSTSLTEDGAMMDVEHSIPILGFYGSWTDATMFDRSTAIDAAYSDTPAYFTDNAGKAGLQVKYPDGTSAMYMGNPYRVEDEFPADRLAMSSATNLNTFKYGLIRNAASAGYAITDANGEALATGNMSSGIYAPYYYPSQGVWQSTGLQSERIGRAVSALGVKAGDQFTVGLYAVPEYYGMQLSDGKDGHITSEQLVALLKDGKLGEGAGIAYTVTVDDKAPEILSATMSEDGKSVTVTAKDDNYIAYLGVMDVSGKVSYLGETPEQTDKGETVEATFQLDPETMGNAVAIFVGDYAKNENASLVRLADGPIVKTTTVYMLTDVLEAGKEYVIADVNQAGKANVLNSQGTDALTNAVAATVVTDDLGTYIPGDSVAATSVWTTSEGIVFTNNDDGGVLGYYQSGYPFACWSNPNYADALTYNPTDHTMILSGTNGMAYSNGYFLYTNPATAVYLYEKVELEEEIDPDNASAVIVNPHALTLILGVDETRELTVSVEPIVLPDKSVTWTSSDPAVATVDENGVVTAVSEGTTTITAASNATPDVTDTCVVNVASSNPLNAKIRGQVAFGNSDIRFVEIDLNDMSTTTLSEEPFSAFVGGGRSGNFVYGCDIDGDFHRYDATNDYAYDSDYHWAINTTYMPLDIGSLPYFDMYDADGKVLAEHRYDFITTAANGWLMMFYDGSSASYFDLTDVANFVAICFAGIDVDEETNNVTLYYYALTDEGVIYAFAVYGEGEDLTIGYGEIAQVGVLSMGEDPTAYSMAYAGGTELRADGVFIADNNNQSIYYVEFPTEEVETIDAVYVGRIDGATNLSALYDNLFDTVPSLAESTVDHINSHLTGTKTMESVSISALGEKRSDVFGGLNEVVNMAEVPARPDSIIEQDMDEESGLYMTALAESDANGLYEFKYDPKAVEFAGAYAFYSEHFFYYDDGEGTVKFDFANPEAGPEFIVLGFNPKCEPATVDLVTKELGDNLDAGRTEEINITGLGHIWGKPTWEWADDFSTATATFVCDRDDSHVEKVEAEITVATEEGKFIYTATVTGPDGKTYTDVQEQQGYKIIVDDRTGEKATADVEPLYAPGEVTFTVACDEPCVVAVNNGDGTYTLLPCTTEDEVHKFTVTIVDADVTVSIALKGDADLNGTVALKDSTLTKRVVAGLSTFDDQLSALAVDFDGNGVFNKDATKISQVVAGLSSYNW